MQSSQTSPASPQTSQFTAVVTTGIYCREGCNGRPLARNTRPYAFAAAAEADGFRPCLRCRPDREPDAAWVDAPELVCRALRLIVDGALDDATEDDLADATRRERPPSAAVVRRTHRRDPERGRPCSARAHFARRLLDDTDLPMTKIATAAGFQSVRHMNRVVKQVFRFTPGELRARRRDPSRLVADGGLELRLPYRRPSPGTRCSGSSRPGDPGCRARRPRHAASTGARSASTVRRASSKWERAPTGRHCCCARTSTTVRGLVHLVSQVRRMFDLDADPEVIDRHLARDPRLRPLVRAHRGLRVPGAIDGVEIGVRAILGQQVSVAHATRLAGRLVAAYGTPVAGLDALGLTHLFPEPATLADAPIAELGMPAARGRDPGLRGVDRAARRVAGPGRAGRRAVPAPRSGCLDGAVRRDAGRGRTGRVPVR